MSVQYGYFVQQRADLAFGEHGRQALLNSRLDYIDLGAHMHTAYPGLLTDGRSGRIGYYVLGTPYSTQHLRSALLHDWHCARGNLLGPAERAEVRRGADLLFRECLVQSGVRRFTAWLMYRGVRLHAWATRRRAAIGWQRDWASRDASEQGDLMGIMAYGWFRGSRVPPTS